MTELLTVLQRRKSRQEKFIWSATTLSKNKVAQMRHFSGKILRQWNISSDGQLAVRKISCSSRIEKKRKWINSGFSANDRSIRIKLIDDDEGRGWSSFLNIYYHGTVTILTSYTKMKYSKTYIRLLAECIIVHSGQPSAYEWKINMSSG